MNYYSSNLNKYSTKNPLKKFFINKFINELKKEILILNDVKSILDVGCGEGFLLNEISNITEAKLVGIDNSLSALSYAGEKYRNIEFKKADILNLPYDDNSFDVLLALEILEHLKNPDLALKELRRVTKKYCIISVPDEPKFQYASLMSLKYLDRIGKHPEHLHFWNRRSIGELVSGYFENFSCRKTFPWLLVTAEKST